MLALDEARRAIASGKPGEGTTGFAPVKPPPVAPVNGDWPGDEEDEERRRGKWPLIALALLALALGGYAIFKATTKVDQVEIPRVTGLDVDRASARLDRKGFKVATRELRNKKEPGIVLGSDPAAGKSEDKGSTVTLIVSSGREGDRCPRSRASRSRAPPRRWRRSASRSRRRSSRRRPSRRACHTHVATGRDRRAARRPDRAGRLLRPREGRGAARGRTDAVVRSERGRGARLSTSISEEESDKPKGEVLRQSPDGGSSVPEGSTVTLTVSKGRELVEVPDVTDRSSGSARATLQAAGFRVQTKEKETTEPLEDGQVLSQRLPGGSERPKGTTVMIIVGKLKEDEENGGTEVPVPLDDETGSEGDQVGGPCAAPGSAAGDVRVAVLSGGRSSEHEVSLASGSAVRDGLVEGGHEALDIEIARSGDWCFEGSRCR